MRIEQNINKQLEMWSSGLGGTTTATQYLSVVRAFIRHTSTKPITSISRRDVISFLRTLRSLGSQRRAVSAIRHFFDYLIESNEVIYNPTRRLRLKDVGGPLGLDDRALWEQLRSDGLSVSTLRVLTLADALWLIGVGISPIIKRANLSRLSKDALAFRLWKAANASQPQRWPTRLRLPLLRIGEPHGN
jgi:hypothetical protein